MTNSKFEIRNTKQIRTGDSHGQARGTLKSRVFGNLPSPQSGREGEAPIALLLEGATRAPIIEKPNSKRYDLEERTLNFAKKLRIFIKKVPQNFLIVDDLRQLIRASGSVGANYIEANESLSKKDFAMRIKICRKEAKEARYWLNLIEINDCPILNRERWDLIQESKELMNIFGAILKKVLEH